jgi:hypothetical protein
MHAVAAFVLVCAAGWLLISALGRASSAAGAGRAAGGKRGGQRPLRHEVRLAWEKVRAADWLEERRHERKNDPAGSTQAVAGRTPAAGRPALLRQVREAVTVPFQRRPAASSNGSTPAAPAAPARPAGAPRPTSPSAPPGGTTVASTGTAGAVEQFVEGVNQIHGTAQAGGIHAKHGAVKASHEGSIRFAAMLAMLSRAMSEPGMNYGPEITEPIAKAATHQQAAAMALSEADAHLATLINMTVGDLANSARQAPNHAEMSENGSR